MQHWGREYSEEKLDLPLKTYLGREYISQFTLSSVLHHVFEPFERKGK